MAPSVDTGFRYDINALRALAVMLVLLFHFRVPGFGGGFVGVDVFFVVSGYLMTAMIVTRLQAQTFQLGRFYLARAGRIVPALAALIGTLLALGWWLLPQSDYHELADNSVYALIFIANIRFQRDAGYFAPASHDNWLLHTWSLGVEAQFYLLLPLFILLIWRIRPGQRQLLIFIVVVLLMSLARSVWLAYNSPDSAFFLLQSRAWQLLTGAAAFLLSQHRLVRQGPQFARLLSASGLLLILGTALTVNASTRWPGLLAIVPVAGTALILMTARQSAWMRLAPVHYLGLSSYSIYLWHWPVFVALAFLGMTDNALAIIAGMTLAIALGLLSWRVIENPTRRSRKPGTALTLIIAVTLVPAIWIDQLKGVPGRLSPAVEHAEAEARNFDDRRGECLARNGFDFPWCQYGGPDIQAIVVGDSHASTVFTAAALAVEQGTTNPGAGIRASSHNGCATLLDGNSIDNADGCRAFNRFLREQIQTMPAAIPLIIVNRSSIYHLGSAVPASDDFRRPLIFYQRRQSRPSAQLTQQYREDLIATACHFAEQRPVYLLRPIPEMPVDVPRSMARRHLLNRAGEVRLSRAAYDQRHAAVWQAQDQAAQHCGVRILDPTQALCDEEYCYGSEDGRPLYYDEDHLSEYGNKKLVPLFKNGDGGNTF
ncbi:MAG: acyltransferase family protein [Pseudohongiella sp.]|uniref:acyltransferase family protein n=1 Tax=Pseudohongiella sp. TaxID=1979412 RepID=UPI00349FE9CC